MEWESREPRILLDEMSDDNAEKMAKRRKYGKTRGKKKKRVVKFSPKTKTIR